jgi:hypothetical protein
MKWFKVDKLIRVFLKNYTVKCKYLFWFKKNILMKIVVFVYLLEHIFLECEDLQKLLNELTSFVIGEDIYVT